MSEEKTETTTTKTETSEPVVHPPNEAPEVFRETVADLAKPDPVTSAKTTEHTETKTSEK